ncbi:MAG: HAMP domain-containing protein [Betaproteobacteria bacterium]|nr:HAMP domain-containing protein [Betaproteobacteria bacterium]
MRFLPSSLFARTFFLISLVLCSSLLGWMGFVRVSDRTPRAQRLAWEVTSVVNLTRNALVTAQPDLRRRLLNDLALEEGVRVVPSEETDQIQLPPSSPFLEEVASRLRELMGPSTTLASAVNSEPAFWIRTRIAGDAYWIAINQNRIERHQEPEWAEWIATALAASLLIAFGLSQWLNRPLARLAVAIEQVAAGQRPGALPEAGPGEIAQLNRRFNRLTDQLSALDSDRKLALAGISHDLRTPLARLRLELELTDIPDAPRVSMVEEIDRIDAIVGQFIEFARDPDDLADTQVCVAEVIDAIARAHTLARQAGSLDWVARVPTDLYWTGRIIDLERIVSNLVDNALLHGRSPDGTARLEISATKQSQGITLEVVDQGPGVPADALEQVLRPFARIDSARSASAGGAGLGLAIVDRLAQRAGGRVRLFLPTAGGLGVRVELPDFSRSRNRMP